MKKKYLIIIMILFIINCNEKTQTDVSDKHTLEKKYYDNGQLMLEGYKIDGLLDGKITMYYENGIKKVDETYNKGILHGNWTYYYENGKKQMEGEFINGKKNNKWIQYYENGKKWGGGNFIDGKEIGEWIIFDTDENISMKISYNGRDEGGNLIRHGEMVDYYKNGQIKVELNFVNGQIVGKSTEYYDNGKIMGTGIFNDGISDWIKYYQNGKIKEKGKYLDIGYEDRKKIDRWIYYNKDGNIEKEEIYKNGELIESL